MNQSILCSGTRCFGEVFLVCPYLLAHNKVPYKIFLELYFSWKLLSNWTRFCLVTI